ncbi:MAG: hypothetical protein K5864_04310 [Bacteroidales bacterium]|nr:hypothetical protein [Bacteroidales bacterium]
MKLRNYLEEKASEWVGYQRPAVDWMITEKGKPNSRLERTLHDFPEFTEVVKQIPRPLSRQDVLKCYEEDLYKGFVATLLCDRLRRDPFVVYQLFPFLVEPTENVQAKLNEIQAHLRQGDLTLSELFTACESPSKLQIAERINSRIFTLTLDHLAMTGCKITHPLMYNPRMRDVHCALLLENVGTSQPFYNIEGDRVTINDNSSEAECYEDFCMRLGNLSLWAGSGNPEFLVDWMNYSDDGRLSYLIAYEVIVSFRKSIHMTYDPSHYAFSLAEFVQQGFQCIGNKDAYLADYATNLYMENDTEREQMLQLLEDNNLVENRGQYKEYSRKNKGCCIENPFTINTPWEEHSRFEDAIADFVIYWSSTENTHRELTNVSMHHIGSKWIESPNYNVYRNGKRATESYYFDLTQFFNQQ